MMNAHVQAKIVAMLKGERVITYDAEMDAMSALDGDTMNRVRSIPNPTRVGLLDQYVAWIEPAAPASPAEPPQLTDAEPLPAFSALVRECHGRTSPSAIVVCVNAAVTEVTALVLERDALRVERDALRRKLQAVAAIVGVP